MHNITIIYTMHLEIGKCNSVELYKIIEGESPEIIFEEFDISRIDDEYYRNGHYKYQKSCSVETTAIMKYLDKHKIIHIPVDTYDLSDVPEDMYPKISAASELYNNLIKNNFVLSCQQGFQYLNSIECSDMLEKIRNTEKEIIDKLNDKKLYDTYKSWQFVTESRENKMLENIYHYSYNHDYNKAVFIIGADHGKSIQSKIREYDSKNRIKIDWQYWHFA